MSETVDINNNSQKEREVICEPGAEVLFDGGKYILIGMFDKEFAKCFGVSGDHAKPGILYAFPAAELKKTGKVYREFKEILTENRYHYICESVL